MNLHELYDKELHFIERIEKLYIYLEHIKMKDAKLFSESSKANLRRAQSELQHMRLLLYDMLETSPQKEIEKERAIMHRLFHNSTYNMNAKTNKDKNTGASAQAVENMKNIIKELDKVIAISYENERADKLKELRQRLDGIVVSYESTLQKTVRIEILLGERDRLHDRMQAEWDKYKKAIDEGKSFAETNEIYLSIKGLQAQSGELTEQIHETLRIGN